MLSISIHFVLVTGMFHFVKTKDRAYRTVFLLFIVYFLDIAPYIAHTSMGIIHEGA